MRIAVVACLFGWVFALLLCAEFSAWRQRRRYERRQSARGGYITPRNSRRSRS
jgi:hypothetical protein